MKQKDLKGIIGTIEDIADFPWYVEKLTEYVDFEALSELYSVYSAAASSNDPGLNSHGHFENIQEILKTLDDIKTILEDSDNDFPFAVSFTENMYNEQSENCHALSRAIAYLEVFYIKINSYNKSFKLIQGDYYLSGSCDENKWIHDVAFENYLDELIDSCERFHNTLEKSSAFVDRKLSADHNSDNISTKAEYLEDALYSLDKSVQDEMNYLDNVRELCILLGELYDRLEKLPPKDSYMTRTKIKRSYV